MDRMLRSKRFLGMPTNRSRGDVAPYDAASSHRHADRQKSGKRCRPVPELFQLSLPRSTLRCSRSVTGPAFRCGRRRLRFRAHSRLWRDVAQARPPARIAPSRKLQVRHRRLCRASTCADSSLHSRRSPALRSAPARQPRSPMGEGNFSWAAPSPPSMEHHRAQCRMTTLSPE